MFHYGTILRVCLVIIYLLVLSGEKKIIGCSIMEHPIRCRKRVNPRYVKGVGKFGCIESRKQNLVPIIE